MDVSAPKTRMPKTAFCAFFLAAFSCALGLVFCLVKSPQARAGAYIAAAADAMDHGHADLAAASALEAVRLDPMRAQGWKILSVMLQQKGNVSAAAQARTIAFRVQQNPDDTAPIYAIPAEFKLSLLALSETQTP